MNLLLLPGDGIGPEISKVVADVIDCLNSKLDLGIDLKEKDFSKAHNQVKEMCEKLLVNKIIEDFKIIKTE